MNRLLIALGLILFSGVSNYVLAQSDSLYTLPIEKARLLVADALAKRVLDSIVTVQEQQISVLEYQAGKLSATVTGLTLNHEQQIRLEQGRAEDFRQLSEVWRKEAKKKVKGDKLWKVLTVVGTAAGIYAGSRF